MSCAGIVYQDIPSQFIPTVIPADLPDIVVPWYEQKQLELLLQ